MLASERFEKIVEIVNQKGFISTKELSVTMQVTETTIRRDCEELPLRLPHRFELQLRHRTWPVLLHSYESLDREPGLQELGPSVRRGQAIAIGHDEPLVTLQPPRWCGGCPFPVLYFPS